MQTGRKETDLIQKTNLAKAFGTFSEHWSPRIAGRVNDMHVKLAKLEGDFIWHHHETEDELFLVIKGSLLMKLRDGEVRVNEGEFVTIPRGVEHCPCAETETWVMLFEPITTLNTGNVSNERTVRSPHSL